MSNRHTSILTALLACLITVCWQRASEADELMGEGGEGLSSPVPAAVVPALPLDLTPTDQPDLVVAEAADPIAMEQLIWRTPRKRRLQNYVQADFLLWWLDDSQLPELLTTNPAGTAVGDVGTAATTRALLGNESVGDWPHAGLRLRFGHFVPDSRVSRLELDVWHLFQGTDDFQVQSAGGTPILSRPFFNSQSGAPDAQIISFPGLASGSFRSEYSRQMLGVDPSIFFCLSASSCRWFELSTGYRFLWLQDELKVNERVELEPGGLIAPGSGYEVEDRFTADNRFHLWTIGLSHSENRGQWLVNVRGNIGLGLVAQQVEVRGQTDSFVGSNVTNTTNAGLLALRTNRGKHRQSEFTYVPELNFNLKRRLGKHLTAHAGYTLMWLPDVVKAVDHVPTTIDPRNIPTEQPGAGPDPQFAFVEDSLLMHGMNFGVRYDW